MEGASRRSSGRARVLQIQAERLLDDFFASGGRAAVARPRSWEPRADVHETAHSIVIQVELCAISRDEIVLSLVGDRLVLRGTRCVPAGEQHVRYHQLEIPCGPFERIFQLPPDVCEQPVKAKLKDGLLTVVLSKRAG